MCSSVTNPRIPCLVRGPGDFLLCFSKNAIVSHFHPWCISHGFLRQRWGLVRWTLTFLPASGRLRQLRSWKDSPACVLSRPAMLARGASGASALWCGSPCLAASFVPRSEWPIPPGLSSFSKSFHLDSLHFHINIRKSCVEFQ